MGLRKEKMLNKTIIMITRYYIDKAKFTNILQTFSSFSGLILNALQNPEIYVFEVCKIGHVCKFLQIQGVNDFI